MKKESTLNRSALVICLFFQTVLKQLHWRSYQITEPRWLVSFHIRKVKSDKISFLIQKLLPRICFDKYLHPYTGNACQFFRRKIVIMQCSFKKYNILICFVPYHSSRFLMSQDISASHSDYHIKEGDKCVFHHIIESEDAKIKQRPTNKRQTTRLPKTRSKTGCFTCRKRKKKCDEKSAVCSGCSRNFLLCVWPSHPTETLPKHFEISSSADTHLEMKQAKQVYKSNLEQKIYVEPESEPDNYIKETYDVPIKMCSIMEVKSYKHSVPFPKSTTIPDIVDFVIDDLTIPAYPSSSSSPDLSSDSSSLTSLHHPLDQSLMDRQSLSQMFSSLYESSTVESFISEDFMYKDLLSYAPKAQPISTISCRNPGLAALREIFFARGCSYLCKKSPELGLQYKQAAEKHYNKSVEIIRDSKFMSNNLVSKSIGDIEDSWLLIAIKTICLADKSMGLVTESCIYNIVHSSENISISETAQLFSINNSSQNLSTSLEKSFFMSFLFTYTLSLYFSSFDSFLSSPLPFKLFDQYNKTFAEMIYQSSNPSSFNNIHGYIPVVNNRPPDWLQNVVLTSIINTYENIIKLVWLLRMSKSLEAEQLKTYLKQMKTDMTLIWTTIQTAEIQMDCNSVEINFAKLAHMTLEIMYLKVSDNSMSSSNPIICFYLVQFISSYESLLEIRNNNSDIEDRVPKCMFIMPLFIAGCAAQSLEQKEFISKEMYLISRELNMSFVEKLAFELEDKWCIQEKKGDLTFDSLITRNGFLSLTSS